MEVWEIFLLPWQYWAMLGFGIALSFLAWYIKRYDKTFDFLPKIINILNMVSSIVYAIFVDNLIKNYGKYLYTNFAKAEVENKVIMLTEYPEAFEVIAQEMSVDISSKISLYNNIYLVIDITITCVLIAIIIYLLKKSRK